MRTLLLGVLAAAIGLAAAGCGDDGNDRSVALEQTRERAAELRAESAAAPEAEPGDEDAVETTGATDTAEPSESEPVALEPTEIELTGEVIPVLAIDNTFRPQRIEVVVGDEVVWENRGMNEHDILWIEGDDWGVATDQFQPGDAYSHVFTEPGEYRYYCSIHGNEDVGMVGTLIVTE